MAQVRPFESYNNHALRGAWLARGTAIWSFAAFGLAVGAVMGCIAPFFPLLVGAPAALGVFWNSVAIFAATGMGAGFAVGGIVGASAGAAAAVAKEQEIRAVAHEQELRLNSIPQGLPATTIKPQRWTNFKVGALFAVLGMGAGALIAASGGATFLPAYAVISAGISGTAAAALPMAYSMGVMGMFGALWSMNASQTVLKINDFTTKLMGGELLGTSWDLPEPTRAQAPQLQQPRSFIPLMPEPARRHASFSEMLEQQPATQVTQR
jgi:hypothetical protein